MRLSSIPNIFAVELGQLIALAALLQRATRQLNSPRFVAEFQGDRQQDERLGHLLACNVTCIKRLEYLPRVCPLKMPDRNRTASDNRLGIIDTQSLRINRG